MRKSATFISASVIAVVLLLVGFVVFQQGAVASDQSGRLVTIYDRGQEKILLTDSETIAEVLEEANVTLDSRDTVEPALDQKLIASEYQVNIYRARPVTIVDGLTRQKVMTPYQTAEQIVQDADITLYSEDETKLTRSDDIVADGAGLQLNIDRATVFTFDLYGARTETRTQAETVADMLQEKGISLTANDKTSPEPSSPITPGIEVKVWREGKQTITAQEAVAFDVQQIQDADREIGYKEVKTAGVNGQRNVTYEIDIKDGVEVSRVEIASIVTIEPTKQVEVVGAKVLLTVTFSADKAAIMTAAGVAPADQQYAAYIINNENALWCAIRWQGTKGCGIEYYEKFPGAETSAQVGYGLCQSTPAIKMATAGADWRTNAVTQMKWCHSYAIGRYGSWEAAYIFKVKNGWW